MNALRAIDTVGPVATPIDRHGINVGTIVGSTVSTTMTWPAATDALSGVKSYAIKRSLNGARLDDADRLDARRAPTSGR